MYDPESTFKMSLNVKSNGALASQYDFALVFSKFITKIMSFTRGTM